MKYFLISIVCFLASWLLVSLVTMWQADKSFAYGKNLDSVGEYVAAYPYLVEAIKENKSEPYFRGEISINEAIISSAIWSQINSSSQSGLATLSAQEKLSIIHPQFGLSTQNLIDQAKLNSDFAIQISPNSFPYWKERARVFAQLSLIDPKYGITSLEAMETASRLAPTDAKVSFNLGLLLGQVGNLDQAIVVLERTIAMKQDYRDAYFKLGEIYKKRGDIEKARKTMEAILKNIGPDKEAQSWLNAN